MKGTISKVTDGISKLKSQYQIYTIDGEMYTAFDKDHQGYEVGEEIEFEFAEKGKYKNITKINLIHKEDKMPGKITQETLKPQPAVMPTPISVPMPPAFKKGKYGAELEDDIHLQVALKIASEQLKPKATPEQIVIYAKQLLAAAWK